jgi:hypothetical protein
MWATSAIKKLPQSKQTPYGRKFSWSRCLGPAKIISFKLIRHLCKVSANTKPAFEAFVPTYNTYSEVLAEWFVTLKKVFGTM